MTEEDPIFACSGCGASRPRSDMFGVEPELLCETCSEGVRKRMHVRFKPLAKDHVPRATALCLAIAAVLFVCDSLIWPEAPAAVRPAWLEALFVDPAVWLGQIWRYATAMFLHAGLLHIAMNASALWYLGRGVEQLWGTPRFLALFLLTGMAGMAVEWAAHWSNPVGLSGGIMGLAGYLMARRKDHPGARAVMQDGLVRMIWIVMIGGIAVTQLGLMPIANWGHGVGLATGYLFGVAARYPARRALVPLVGLLCVGILIASVFFAVGSASMKNGETWTRQRYRDYWVGIQR